MLTLLSSIALVLAASSSPSPFQRADGSPEWDQSPEAGKVDDARIERDRASYKPLRERVPTLNLTSGPLRYPTPIEDGADWVSLSDYPIAAWNEGRTGAVEARVYVSKEGAVITCAIMISSGHEDLDQATCNKFGERAMFRAGSDELGPAVGATFDFLFTWEKTLPAISDTIRIKTRTVVGKDGLEQSCELLELSGPAPERLRRQTEREPCWFGITRNRAPYRDAEGNPVVRAVISTMEMTIEDVSEEEAQAGRE